jgi:hypothetical protein
MRKDGALFRIDAAVFTLSASLLALIQHLNRRGDNRFNRFAPSDHM